MDWTTYLRLQVEIFIIKLDLHLRKAENVLSQLRGEQNGFLKCFKILIICWQSLIKEVILLIDIDIMFVPSLENQSCLEFVEFLYIINELVHLERFISKIINQQQTYFFNSCEISLESLDAFLINGFRKCVYFGTFRSVSEWLWRGHPW